MAIPQKAARITVLQPVLLQRTLTATESILADLWALLGA
jgi:hypothetical protein